MNYYLNFWKDTFNFNKKVNVKEFWFTVLWNVIVTPLIVVGLSYLAVYLFSIEQALLSTGLLYVIFFLSSIFSFATLSFLGRRLNDAAYSKWWLLILLVPVMGQVAALIFGLLPSKVK